MSGLSNLGGAPKCPRCSKSVYFAEEVVAKGKKWHKTCLNCAACGKTLDSFTMNEHEEDIYCKACFKKHCPVTTPSPPQQQNGSTAGVQMRRDSSHNACPRCKKQVYFAEETIAIGKKWHKTCLKCNSCEKRLESGTVTEHDGMPYCKSCYGKNFGPQGYGFAGGSSGLSGNDSSRKSSYSEAQAAPILGRQSSVSSGPKCPKCSNTVYFAEEVIAVGKKWHKSCLKCGGCSKTVDPGSVQEHEGMPYCKACYGKNFGPRGYGFAGGASGLAGSYGDSPAQRTSGYGAAQAASILGEESSVSVGPRCSRCNKTVYFAEEVIACKRKWHKLCLKCASCDKILEIGSLQEHNNEPYCKLCYGKNYGPKGYGFAGGSAGLSMNRDDGRDHTSNSQMTEYIDSVSNDVDSVQLRSDRHSYNDAHVPARTSNYSGAPQCPRCDQPVYFAEEVFAIGCKWHKACLKCNACGKKLDTSSLSEHDREIYCRGCYGKNFGPKGYGFAGGAAGAMSGNYNGSVDYPQTDEHLNNQEDDYEGQACDDQTYDYPDGGRYTTDY